jgi:glycyl-tRNA synthetase beta chain
MPEATHEAVSHAIYDHYKPESMDDSVPRSIEGGVLAIADKADSIAGMFAVGLQPTGSKDPFALRRAANGIVKIIAEHKLPLPISKLFADARSEYAGSEAERRFDPKVNFEESVANFMYERLEFYLRDVRGFAYDVVKAVLAAGSDDVVDAIARAEATAKVRELTDFVSIAAAFKRINNILKQAQEKGIARANTFDMLADAPDEERNLAARIEEVVLKYKKASADTDYSDALIQLSSLRPDIDRYFDKVMVMVDDERVRANRLSLLAVIRNEFSTIGDFTQIVTEGN